MSSLIILTKVLVVLLTIGVFLFPSLNNTYFNSGTNNTHLAGDINTLTRTVRELQVGLGKLSETQHDTLTTFLRDLSVNLEKTQGKIQGLSENQDKTHKEVQNLSKQTEQKIQGVLEAQGRAVTALESISNKPTSTHANNDAKAAEYYLNLQALSKKFKEVRKEVGKLRCEKEAGIGGTGGFCLWGHKKFEGAGGNDYFDHPAAVAIENFLEGKSIYDLGCGVGRYGAFWSRNERVPSTFPYNDVTSADGPRKIKSWVGMDGSEGVEENTDNWVEFFDLTNPAWMPPRDWVVSLEVGEHIPADVMRPYLENLDRHCTEGILLSWAVRGQEGFYHVNNLDNHEVIDLMRTVGEGYTYDEVASKNMRSKATLAWFKETLMVFRKN